MEELQKTQNKNCNLSMPEGLQNLMYDISREVLRAQPENMYQFVGEYLGALLAARDGLAAAWRLCRRVCEAPAPLRLGRALARAGLSPKEAATAQRIVDDFLQDGQVTKENLSARLMEADIDRSKIASVKRAVETEFKRNIMETISPFDIQLNCNPEAQKAAANTLQVYRKPVPVHDEEYHSSADELKVPYGEDNKKVHMRSRDPSADSSEDIFENVHSDGDIQDFYVSGINKPYRNSSLTSLAGSYGLAKCKELASYRAPEQEDRVISYDEEEDWGEGEGEEGEENEPSEAPDTKDSVGDDEVFMSLHNEFTVANGNGPMPDGSTNYEDDVIEDYVSDADNDSDVSLDEEFD